MSASGRWQSFSLILMHRLHENGKRTLRPGECKFSPIPGIQTSWKDMNSKAGIGHLQAPDRPKR